MAVDPSIHQGGMQERRMVSYLVEAAVLIVALFVLSKTLPTMPVWGIAVAWALLSLLPAIGYSYHWVVRKTYNLGKFQDGGRIKRFAGGRVICLVASFVVSAVFMAGLLVECPKWNAIIWVLVILAVPGYLAVSLLLRKFVSAEYAPLFRESRTAIGSAVVLAIILCLVYAVVLYFLPAAEYARAADAFVAQPRPFDGSPSSIMSEYGMFAATIDGLRSYAMSKWAEGSFGLFVLWHLLLIGSTFFGVSSLLATCIIDPRELRRVFSQLQAEGALRPSLQPQKSYVAVAAVLPIVLAAGFVFADGKAADIMSTRAYTMAEEFARTNVSLVVYALDGKYYDPKYVDELLAETSAKSDALAAQTQKKMVELTNAYFDTCEANVDSYLDWYYRPFGDWETLFKEFTSRAGALVGQEASESAEEFLNSRFTELVCAGADDGAIAAEFDALQQDTENLEQETLKELEKYELTEDYPEFLIVKSEGSNSFEAKLDLSLKPTTQTLTARQRLGISAGAGMVAGFVAKRLIAKMGQKTLFKAATGRLVGLLAGAGSGAVVGGLPGAAVTTVATLLADLGLQKADEVFNREPYKREILDTINEQRNEALQAIEGGESGEEVASSEGEEGTSADER